MVPLWRRVVRRLAWFEPLWVMTLSLLLLVPPRFLPAAVQPYTSSLRPIVVLLLPVFWPIRWLAYRQFTRRTPLDWPLLFLVMWLPVTYWASVDKALSWEAISYLASGIMLYAALINWPPAQLRPQLIGWIILLVGLGLTLAAPLVTELVLNKLFLLPSINEWLQRLKHLTPGSVNPNRMSGVLILIMPLPLALAVRCDWTKRRWLPALNGLFFVLMLIALALTQSRSAYLAAAVALALILILRWPRLRYVALALIALGLVVLIQIGPRVVLDETSSGDALNGLDGRLELWSRGLYAISDFPFTGIGIGTFDRVIPVLYPLFSIGPDIALGHSHNLLIQITVDLGLPGLIAYLALMLNVFALLIVTLRRRADALQWVLAAGALSGLVAMLIHGIFDVPLWNTKPAFLPWLLIALAVQVGLSAAVSKSDVG